MIPFSLLLVTLFFLPSLSLQSPPLLHSHLFLNSTTVHQGNGRVLPCALNCNFRLCGISRNRLSPANPASFTILHAPRQANFPVICRPRTPTIGRILSVGEAQVDTRPRNAADTPSNFVNISRWRPQGLPRSLSFPNNFFSVAPVPYLPFSGISRQPTQRAFRRFLHNRCVRLPITSFQVINRRNRIPTGRVVNLPPNPNNCVAFRTTAPAIQVELVWDTSDDLDLSLIEPDGDLLSFRTPNLRTERGRLDIDVNIGCPRRPANPFGRENIVYFPDPRVERGEYQVRVKHFRNCDTSGNSPTSWRLTIIKDSVRVETLFGMSNADDDRLIQFTTFTFP